MQETFSPKNKFLWDSWLIRENDKYHIFYLQAEKNCNPENRHDNFVSIGHAISDDLVYWEELPTALYPEDDEDAWDNLSLWTGSIIKEENKYYMYYTGRNKKERLVQKIGIAISYDLIHWTKLGNKPILEADKYYYINNERNKLGKIGAWRDPFVFKDPVSGKYYMSITAREKANKTEYNGCVGLAESEDLINWKLLPPIFSPKHYDELETTQIIYHKGYYYLFFSTLADNYEPEFAKRTGIYGGLHCFYSKSLFGGYKPVNINGVVLANANEMYDIRLLHKKDDEFVGIGWLNLSLEKQFTGKLTTPMTIKIQNDSVLVNRG